MVASPTTKSGTPKLSEVARHLVLPSGIVSSGWPAVRAKLFDLGIIFDEWQVGASRAILAKRADGMYAAGVGGVVISIPRQVGKTFMIGALVFALCLLYPGLTVVWTAHRVKTAAETFKSMQGLAKRKRIAPFIEAVPRGSGNEAVIFRNGSRVLFGARETGFGRGFTKVGIVVFDEAQIMTEATLDDIIPAANQGENPLVIMTGTPPRPIDPGEVFSTRRAEALSSESDDILYIELSADPKCDPSSWPAGFVDFDEVGRANPSYPDRTPKTSILRMFKMLGPASFRREGLGIWDDGSGEQAAIRKPQWDAILGVQPDAGADVFGVKFSGELVSLAAARRPTAGPIFVEGLRQESLEIGHEWLVAFLAERAESMAGVVVDGKEGVGPLVADLIEAGVPRKRITVPTVDQVITAHAGFLGAVRTHGVEHSGQPALTAEVLVAGKRKIGRAGGWGWRSIEDEGTVVTLEAATLAWWLVKTSKRAAAGGGRSGGQAGRRVANGASRRAGTVGSRVPHPQPAG